MEARRVGKRRLSTNVGSKRLGDDLLECAGTPAAGRKPEAAGIFSRIYEYSIQLEAARPEIDYFATSLPAMLLLNEDLAQRNRMQARFLRAQAFVGLGSTSEAEALLLEILGEISITVARPICSTKSDAMGPDLGRLTASPDSASQRPASG